MNDKESHVKTHRKPLQIVWIGAILIALTLIICVITIARGLRMETSPDQLEWIQKISKFRYPPSAKVSDAEYFGMQGWTANTSFTMLPSDLDTLVASTPIKVPLAEYGLPTGICKYQLSRHFIRIVTAWIDTLKNLTYDEWH